MTGTQSDPLWTRAFVLLCIVQFLGYAQHFSLQPTIPIYVTHLGASPFVVDLVMASFAATSMLLRPLVGSWSDRWSEAGVMISGLLIQAASVILSFVPVIGAMMIANSCRGAGWASVNSGGYALLAQCAPAARRGEASGYYSGAQGSATIILPALALWLIDAPFGGFHVVFAASMTIAIIGAGTGMPLSGRNTIGEPIRHRAGAGPWWREILTLPEKDILLASGLLFALHISLPAVAGFLVLYARRIGIENFGWYDVISGATSLIARPVLGWASDKIGRGSALALEHANPERRGQVIATYSMANPRSAGVGSLLAGSATQFAGYFWMFLFAAALNIPGLIVTFKNWSSLK